MARLKKGDRQEWTGGYRRWDGTGWTYYLKLRDARLGRDPDGRAKRREVCTGARSEEVALLHLTAFQKNPLAYEPAVVMVGRAPLPFTDSLCVEFLQFLTLPENQGGKGDTPHHCDNARYALKWWRDQLGEVNLRALTFENVYEHVPVVAPDGEEPVKSRKLKVQIIKSFISWLRGGGRPNGLGQGEGPDLSILKIPQHRGRKLHDPVKALERMDKGQRALDGHALLREKLAARKQWLWARDALDLQAEVGWHNTEVERWVKLGCRSEAMPAGREHEGHAVLITVHKSGDILPTPVSRFGYEASQRLKTWCESRDGRTHQGWNPKTKQTEEFASKKFPRQQYERLCRRVCRVHGIPEFGPGHLRHAVATYNARQGVDSAVIGSYLGHSDAQKGELVRTTYADARSQLSVVKAQVKRVPTRIASPLEALMEKQRIAKSVNGTAANDNT